MVEKKQKSFLPYTKKFIYFLNAEAHTGKLRRRRVFFTIPLRPAACPYGSLRSKNVTIDLSLFNLQSPKQTHFHTQNF